MSLPTTEEIIDDLAFFDDWEQRYQYIIDLGKALPAMSETDKTEERLVRGCQSSVWLKSQSQGEQLHFEVASDAIIVNGLLALVMAAYQDKSAAQILAFDIDGYFHSLDLERHISPTRGNGLRAIVAKIRALAEQH
ncbi:SufE family protein [Bowmanella yangjiangensis]|uniref:SufE family protein n=1 Tax=Bowmanella yangjiangensis TaxID=2811230 RepID=A0ABS3CR62_9ALTE|nr:SufE family protein [Bowmanella yangjiangensis]MBN7818785.1 SufE family protein [Bowmanella yangjiangensis]